MKCLRTIIKSTTAVVASLLLILGTAVGVASNGLPNEYRVTQGQQLELPMKTFHVSSFKNKDQIATAAFCSQENNYKAQLMLFHTIPIKTVDVLVVNEARVVPCGTPFGIKMMTNGVVIVGTADIQTEKETVNPAIISGLKIGDIIEKINNVSVNQNEEVAKAVENSNGKPLTLQVKRENKVFTTQLTPVKSEIDSAFKGGLWVRDSTAGIGTVTFYVPQSGAFGGLGHGICDVDTAELMPLGKGDIVPVTINGIIKGEKGRAGELRGYFNSDVPVGNLCANVDAGVYGVLNAPPSSNQTLKLAMKQEVKVGSAKILTTLDGNGPKYYDIQIDSINYKDQTQSKNMVIRVTDPELLEKTGGIIQGMSGSPIIQNEMLVGAVTHVFVNDPTCGYGIFAENMLNIAESIDISENISKN